MPDQDDRQQWLTDRKVAAEEAHRQTELHDEDRKLLHEDRERFIRNHARFEAQMDRLDAFLDKQGCNIGA